MSLKKTDSDDADVSLTKSDVVLSFNMEVIFVGFDKYVKLKFTGSGYGSSKFKISAA